jgi:endonuclease/exonuclease/phosphatase family metal-dependent hydrolase
MLYETSVSRERRVVAVVCALVLAACGGGGSAPIGPGPDGGGIVDSGLADAASDADAAAVPDAAADADAAAGSDAASDADAAAVPDADAASVPDADAASVPDGAAPDASLADAAPRSPLAIRFVSSNLTSGNNQRYEEPGAHILAGLHPDVVLIQELNVGDNQPATLRAFVDATFGPEFNVFRESATGIPNGIISRYPILESGTFDDPSLSDREFVFARLDVPGDRDLWAISLHLKASASSAPTRTSEATALVAAVHARVPEGDYLVVGGDLNTQNTGEACLTTLAGIVVTTGPFPVDQAGEINTNLNRTKPYDRVLFDADLAPLEVPVVLGASAFDHGLVFDSRVYTPLTDAAPVLAGDSGASGMQHMAVVRDVVLPAPTP